MPFLSHVTRFLSLACRIAVGLTFFALIVVVTIQITTRTFDLPSYVWTEELSRYLLLYMVAFGIGLSLMTGEFVAVDLVQEAVPERIAWWMRLVATAATAVLAAVMIWPAWRFVSIGAFQRSPSLRITMDIVHASVFTLAILLFLFATLRVVGMLAGTDDGRPQRPEEI
ncbi:TRAP transporter small permease [Aureimonas mangrovi]|uniref:TRAP transporter small permease n=1 Tax=Aureimonas mangrovi TaxID=2758041 RepID=UPI00163D7065|nr:TRAP transporter small permease subunit [Aureimonas mangrovi]